MGKIGVLGATGKVGRELVKLLKDQNQEFCAFVRDSQRASKSLGENIATIPFSFDNPDTYEPALKEVDRLFLIFPSGVPNLPSKVEAFLQLAKEKGVTRVVAMTGMSADQYPNAWMAQMETKIKECGIPFTFLRPNWFMQNFNTFFGDQILREATITLPAGESQVTFIDVRDIAAVAARVLKEKGHEGKTYTLTGPEALTHSEIADHLSDQIGYRVEYIPQTDEEMIRRWQREGWPLPEIEEMLLLFQKMREGTFSPASPDVEKVLGRPAKKFKEFTSENRHFWRKEQKI